MRGLPQAKRGFTLIEIIVIMALLAFILGIGMVIGFSALSRSSLLSERDFIALALTGARARALANVSETSHGVRIEEDQIVVFEGASPGTDQKITERNSAITVSPSDVEVIFNPLTATVNDDVEIELSDGTKSATIEVNTEGRIEW